MHSTHSTSVNTPQATDRSHETCWSGRLAKYTKLPTHSIDIISTVCLPCEGGPEAYLEKVSVCWSSSLVIFLASSKCLATFCKSATVPDEFPNKPTVCFLSLYLRHASTAPIYIEYNLIFSK